MRKMNGFRVLTALLIAVLIMVHVPFVTFAETVEIGTTDVIVHNKEKNDEIDELFRLRSELELDYEKNEAQINQIDQHLSLLGVETLTYGEVLNKVGGDVLPAFDYSSTSTTRWTSRRVVVTFYGQEFELQILEGVPLSASSPLRKDYLEIDYEAAGIVAGAVDAIKVLAVGAFGSGAVLGDELSNGVSVLSLLVDAGHELAESLNSSTTIDNVKGSATVSLTVHMKYILVKPYETPDYGNQATCYIGSTVTYLLSTTSVIDVFVNDALYTYHSIESNISDTSTSQSYNNYELPCRNYYNYRYNGINFSENYCIYDIDIVIFRTTRTFRVPYELPSGG